MKRYLDGHIGDLILFSAFVMSLAVFATVFIITREESTLLGGVVMASLAALGTYMQKRPASAVSVDTANIDKIEAPDSQTTPKV